MKNRRAFHENLVLFSRKQVFRIMKLTCLIIFMSVSSVFALSQQQMTVSGTVTDQAGETLPGVTVAIQGTSRGTITNMDGKYSLTGVTQGETIVFSFVGMEPQEVVVGSQSVINVTLMDRAVGLDEVVVVGYGTQKKVTLTAAVSQIGSEIFEDRPTANAVQSLQGSLPGLVISNSSTGGEPGTSPDINIRGFITSAGVGNVQDAGPLVLVDGVEM